MRREAQWGFMRALLRRNSVVCLYQGVQGRRLRKVQTSHAYGGDWLLELGSEDHTGSLK